MEALIVPDDLNGHQLVLVRITFYQFLEFILKETPERNQRFS
jgi:hypothetical protein